MYAFVYSSLRWSLMNLLEHLGLDGSLGRRLSRGLHFKHPPVKYSQAMWQSAYMAVTQPPFSTNLP
jgi:hypothetical protein